MSDPTTAASRMSVKLSLQAEGEAVTAYIAKIEAERRALAEHVCVVVEQEPELDRPHWLCVGTSETWWNSLGTASPRSTTT